MVSPLVIFGYEGLIVAAVIGVAVVLIIRSSGRGHRKKEITTTRRDAVDQVRRLKDLLDTGAINQEEYEKKKKRFLDMI